MAKQPISNPSSPRLRERELAEALRANLKRRKAGAQKAPPKSPGKGAQGPGEDG